MNEYQKSITERWESTNKWKSAEIVYNWDGAVYCKQLDQFYHDVDDLLDCLVDDDREIEWVYTCTKLQFSHASAEYLFAESIDEELYESAWDDVKTSCEQELKELEEILQKFTNAVNKNVTAWAPNYRKIFVLPEKANKEDK